MSYYILVFGEYCYIFKLVIFDLSSNCYSKAVRVLTYIEDHSGELGFVDQGIALMQQHRDAEALVLLGKVGPDDPSYVDAIIHRGLLFFKLGQISRAVSCLKAVLDIDPVNADAYHHMGVIALESGDHGAALTYMRSADALRSDDPDILANLGVALHAVGNIVCAESYLERSLALDPENTHALSALSTLYLDSNNLPKYRSYTDFDTYVSMSAPPVQDNEKSREAFLCDLVTEISNYPSLRDAPLHRSTVAGASTDAMSDHADTATENLRAMFVTEAQLYAARLSCPDDHPLTKLGNRAFTTCMWGNILGAGGHQDSHNHPDALLSGIYYVAVPDEVGAQASGQEGWVEFGRPRIEYHGADQLDVRLIKPHPGMMILFPSYIWHRTLPLMGGDPRISVAIDFIPQPNSLNT